MRRKLLLNARVSGRYGVSRGVNAVYGYANAKCKVLMVGERRNKWLWDGVSVSRKGRRESGIMQMPEENKKRKEKKIGKYERSGIG